MKRLYGYISSYEEAALVVHASRFGGIDLVSARLTADEREQIESGHIFCFSENHNGMKRWTDGRVWSPSKICGEFLVYQEVPRHLSKNCMKRRRDAAEPRLPRARARRDEPLDRTTLHKKTVCIKHDNTNYHIIAYYRPIFVTSSLLDLPYFRRLSALLEAFPHLKDNALLASERALPDFHARHDLPERALPPLLPPDKRSLLEGVALEVLGALGQRTTRACLPDDEMLGFCPEKNRV